MFLSPVEIQHQPLKERRGGYRREDVDKLLEAVVVSYEQVWRERDELRERVAKLEGEVESYRDIERALRDGLVAAQRIADTLRTEAEEQSEELLADARKRAEGIMQDAHHEVDRLQAEVERLRSLEQETQARCRAVLLGALEALKRGRPASGAESAQPERTAPNAEDNGAWDDDESFPLELDLGAKSDSKPSAFDWGQAPADDEASEPHEEEEETPRRRGRRARRGAD